MRRQQTCGSPGNCSSPYSNVARPSAAHVNSQIPFVALDALHAQIRRERRRVGTQSLDKGDSCARELTSLLGRELRVLARCPRRDAEGWTHAGA